MGRRASSRVEKEFQRIRRNQREKGQNSESEKQTLDTWFYEGDYPLLYWLSRIIDDNSSVLDLGGSIGHFLYSIQSKLELPKTLKYTIAELPAAVAFGMEVARERNERRLSFIDSSNLFLAPDSNVFLSAGALQYIPRDLPAILEELRNQPKDVLLHNVPVHADREFYTIQNLSVCEVPYRVYSESKLCNEMESRGYTLVAKWGKDRAIEIPFHRDLVISGYAGFYFQKEN